MLHEALLTTCFVLDLKRLGNQKAEYNSEQLELARKVSAGSRTRKSDVEEARKKADALGAYITVLFYTSKMGLSFLH